MEPDPEWQRLSPLVLMVSLVRVVAITIPGLIAASFAGALELGGFIAFLLAWIALTSTSDIYRVLAVRYRVSHDTVEMHSGLITRTYSTLRRERIRNVDSTANILQRIMGLNVVTIGTGEQARVGDSGDIVLNAVTRAVADALRIELLDRPVAAPAIPAPIPPDAHVPLAAASNEIAVLRWRWLPYSLASWWVLGLPVGVVAWVAGFTSTERAFNIASEAITKSPLASAGFLAIAAAIVITGVLAGSVMRVAQFVAWWWSYELRREDRGSIWMQRGLFTRKSLTMEESRIRGVELAESLLLRVFRGARLSVMTTGIAASHSSGTQAASSAIAPPTSISDSVEIGSAILQEPSLEAIARELQPHPPAALRRRVVRAAITSMLLALLAGVVMQIERVRLQVGDTVLPGVAAGDVVVPGAIAWVVASALLYIAAVASWRGLGHALSSRWIVARSGMFSRRTAVIERSGLVGVIVSASLLQRLAGLVTLTVTTPAGRSAYSVIDVSGQQGVELAVEASQGLIRQFLEPVDSGP